AAAPAKKAAAPAKPKLEKKTESKVKVEKVVEKVETPVVETVVEAKVEAPKPRGRRKPPLDPADIPPPVKLEHQGDIHVPAGFKQADTRPKEKVRVQEDESMWTGAELKAMRKKFEADLVERKLQHEKELRKLAEIIDAAEEGSGHETADTGNATLSREMQLTMVERAEEKVSETEGALARLDRKIYGLCSECGKSIGKLRLQEAFPYATMCVTCKEAYDRY
ncbi:MAG: hypothetical protein RL038_355, partial [Actinomycetota bacterium]